METIKIGGGNSAIKIVLIGVSVFALSFATFKLGVKYEESNVKISCEDADSITYLGGDQYVCVTLDSWDAIARMIRRSRNGSGA